MLTFITIGLLRNSNQYTNQDDENGTKIAQFLTEEKNFDTLTSKNPETVQENIDYETIQHSARLSELRPEDISDRLNPPKPLPETPDSDSKQVNEIIKQKVFEQEKERMLNEWEHKFKEQESVIKTLEQANEHYNSVEQEKQQLKQQFEEQVKLNEMIAEKYEHALEQNIQAINRQKEMEEKHSNDMKQQQQPTPYSAMKAYAEQNIQNPMDLSMSLVIKDSQKSVPQYGSNIVIQSEPLHKLEHILDRQKALKEGDTLSDEDSDELNTENTFKLQEFLIETDNPTDISQALII